MKATITRNGILILSPETEIEAYAVGLWKTKVDHNYGQDRPPIEVCGRGLPDPLPKYKET